jgi:hypothetical protein
LNYDTSSRRSKDDEMFVKAITKHADPNQKTYIFNHNDKCAKDFPHENEMFYGKTKLVIYKMSDPKLIGQAFEAIWEACSSYT